MSLSVTRQRHLAGILRKATCGEALSHQEVVYLLSLEDPLSVREVMAAARQLRERHFANRVFLYGFIYFTTYCRNHCTFCYYRQTNELSPRYRKSLDEVTEIAVRLADSGVHLLDLTMGEDPVIHDNGNFDSLFEIIHRVRETTGLPVMVSPGVVPDEVLRLFGLSRVDWYALYQETHNPALYKKLRVGQSYEERAAKRYVARNAGMLVEDGMLIGVGETTSDRADSILAMKESAVGQVRVMSLVPQLQTPLASLVTPPRIKEYLCIAVMRLVMPDRLIPASLDVDGIGGLKMRLDAGANVVTSIIPPSSSLAGVSQSTLDIEQGLRAVPEVKKVLNEMGLQAAGLDDYVKWIAGQKEITPGGDDGHVKDMHYRRTTAGFGSRVPGQTSRI